MPKRMPTITGARAALVARSAAVLRPHQTWRKPKVAAHFKPAMAVTRVNFVRIEITINRAFMTPWSNQQDPMWHSNAIEPTILGLESWDSDSWMNDLISPMISDDMSDDRQTSGHQPDTIVQGVGGFLCAHCGNGWSSSYADINFWQECRVCQTREYPRLMMPRNGVSSRRTKPHLRRRCQKCVETGRYCNKRDTNGAASPSVVDATSRTVIGRV